VGNQNDVEFERARGAIVSWTIICILMQMSNDGVVSRGTYDSKANVDQARRHAEVLLEAIDRAQRNRSEEREANQTCGAQTEWQHREEYSQLIQ
jgi:hypothetical protein